MIVQCVLTFDIFRKTKDAEIQEKRICTKIKIKRMEIKMKKQKMKRYLSDKKKILYLLS